MTISNLHEAERKVAKTHLLFKMSLYIVVRLPFPTAVRIVSCIRIGWMSKTLKNNFPTPHMRVMASINDAK